MHWVLDAVTGEEGVDLLRPDLCDSMDGLCDQELSIKLANVEGFDFVDLKEDGDCCY